MRFAYVLGVVLLCSCGLYPLEKRVDPICVAPMTDGGCTVWASPTSVVVQLPDGGWMAITGSNGG